MGTDSLVNNTVAGANVDTSNFTVGSSASDPAPLTWTPHL